MLEEVISQNSIISDCIFNMDESGLSVAQKVSKVHAKKEKHQIGAVSSQERGQTNTIICCMGGGGYFIPPGVIFPRKRIKAELQDGAPCRTMFCCQV